MTLTPFVVIWGVLAMVTLGLAFYRNLVLVMHEDDCVHVAEAEQRMVPQQVAMTHRIDAVDRWGKTLTVVAGVFGFVLLSIFLYQGWLATSH